MKGEALLDDEAFHMGVQSWLRTLEPGKVNVFWPVCIAFIR